MKKNRLGKWLRRIAIGFAAFLAVLILLWVFRFPLFGGMIRDALTDALETAGFKASYGELSGSLLGDFTLTDFEIAESPTGLPALKTAKVGRVHASYSLFGLLLGQDRWIREVAVEGVTVVLDLEAPPPPPSAEKEDTGPLGIDLMPRQVRVSGVDLAVSLGEERFTMIGGQASLDANPDQDAQGEFGADELLLVVQGREHRTELPSGRMIFREGVATVLSVLANGRQHEQPVRIDLSRLDREEIDVLLDFPLLGGELFADIKAEFGNEYPAGSARIRLTDLDPAPILAFLPDLPLRVARISFDLTATADGAAEPDLSSLTGEFSLNVEGPVYEDYQLESVRLAGRYEDGRAFAEGEIADPEGSFRIEADLDGNGPLQGSLHLAGLDVKRLRLDIDGRSPTGVVSLDATIGGTIESPTYTAKGAVVSPGLAEYSVDAIEFDARGDLELVEIEQVVVRRGADRVTVTGELRPGDEPIGIRGLVSVDVEEISAYREFIPAELPEEVRGGLSLTVSAEGTLDRPEATITAIVTGVDRQGRPAETLRFTALAPTFESFEQISVKVLGPGSLPDLTITDATATLTEAGVRMEAPTIEVTRDDWDLSAKIRAKLEPDGQMAADLMLESLDLTAVADHLGLDLGISGNLTGRIQAAGTPEDPRADINLSVQEPSSELSELPTITAKSADLKARFENDLITLESFEIVGRRFRIHAAGKLPFSLDDPDAVADAAVTGSVKITSLPLDLAGPLPQVGILDGTVDAELSISGRADDPRVSGELRVQVDRVGITGFESLPVTGIVVALRPEDLGAQSGRILIEEFSLEAAGARLSASGVIAHKNGEPLDPRFDLEITAIDIARIREAFGVDFPVEGNATFGLTLAPGPVIGLSLAVRELALPDNPGMTFDFDGEWREGTFTIGQGRLVNEGKAAEITGTIPFDLAFAPFAAGPSPDRPMDVALQFTGLDLAALKLESEGIRLAGTAGADVTVRGLVSDPDINGVLTLAGVRFRAEGVPGIDKLTGKIAFSRDEVRIEDLAGTLGRGPFKVSGTMAMVDGQPGAADLRIVATNAQLMRSEGMRLRTDLDLTIRGTGPQDLTVGGTVKLRSLKVGATGLLAAQDIETVLAGMKASPALTTLPLTTDPALKDIKLDLTVLIPEGAVHVRTNLVKATANGKLLVGGTLAIPRPRGRIYVPEGTVYLIAGQLELEKPVVTFKEGEPLVPYINGRATARVSGVDVFVNVSGPANNAKVLLSSVPAYPAPDIVSLILTGVTRANLGADALSGMASTYLLRQLSSNFSDDDDEDSVVSDLLSRIEVEFDDRRTGSGGIPGFTATARILDWLFVRGQQESALDYGFDLIFRLTFP